MKCIFCNSKLNLTFLKLTKIIIPDNHPTLGKALFFLPHNQWRINRSTISHTFTNSKLRKNSYIFENELQSLISDLKSSTKNTEAIDIQIPIKHFLLNIVLQSFCGISSDFDKEKKDFLLENISKIVNIEMTFEKAFSYFSPKIASLFGFELLDKKTVIFFQNFMKEIISKRLEDKTKTNDFLQYVLDAKSDENANDKQKSEF
jgi:cytochrome P450